MNPSPDYATQASIQRNPLNQNLLCAFVSLTEWEGMTVAGQQRVGSVLADALRKYFLDAEALRKQFSEAETRVVPAIQPPPRPKPPAHP